MCVLIITSMNGLATLGDIFSAGDGSWESTTNSSAFTLKPESSIGEWTSNNSWIVCLVNRRKKEKHTQFLGAFYFFSISEVPAGIVWLHQSCHCLTYLQSSNSEPLSINIQTYFTFLKLLRLSPLQALQNFAAGWRNHNIASHGWCLCITMQITEENRWTIFERMWP